MPDEPRKTGSTVLAMITGAALVITAICIYNHWLSGESLKTHPTQVDGGSGLVFAAVLFWWAIGNKGNWLPKRNDDRRCRDCRNRNSYPGAWLRQ